MLQVQQLSSPREEICAGRMRMSMRMCIDCVFQTELMLVLLGDNTHMGMHAVLLHQLITRTESCSSDRQLPATQATEFHVPTASNNSR